MQTVKARFILAPLLTTVMDALFKVSNNQ
jgi:hypothetical protein